MAIIYKHRTSIIIHFRRATPPRSDNSNYKYLGCIINENVEYTATAKRLAESADRALGMIIYKFYSNKHMFFHTYTKSYNSCICSIMDYASGVWGHDCQFKCNTVQNMAIQIFLGVYKYASNVVIKGDVRWVTPA